MDTSKPKRRGLYFEEFEIGHKIITAGRTITESDVVTFAGLSGDFNQIHVDAQFSQNTQFGKRVAHGLLVLSVASGLAVQTGVMEGTVIAFREITDWKFSKPVYLGDTIHVEMEVTDTKEYPRLGAGAIMIGVKVVNQQDDIVMRGTWNNLMQLKPAGE